MRVARPALVVLLAAAACSGDSDPGELATWRLDPSVPVESGSTTFTALVQRIECASGVTGTVLEPTVDTTGAGVVITFFVEPLAPGVESCPENDPVPFVVDLDEPLGDRRLVDGACLRPGDFERSVSCQPDADRWVPSG